MESTFNYDGKHVVVTGGASGIGLAIAQKFARQGAHVFVVDLNPEAAEAAAASIREQGGLSSAVACDVSQMSSVVMAVGNILGSVSRIDVLINNAGVAHIGTAESTKPEDFERIFNVNVKGVYNMIHAVVEPMKRMGGGVILNMASIAATVGIPDRFAYSMSKGAVLSMTLSVARDFIHDNIRCNAISPARVHTPFVDGFLKANYPGQEQEMFDRLSKTQPIGRMGKPEEVAALALYLCSDEASFVTGCDYLVDGGFVRLNT